MALYCHDMIDVIALSFFNLYCIMLYRVQRTSSLKILRNLLSPSSYIFIYKNFIRLISANEKELYKNNLRVKAPVLIKTLRFTEI